MSSEDIDRELLISEVQARPVLWNDKDTNYKKTEVTKKEWLQVAKIVGMPVSTTKAKWKNLKDKFRIELKKLPECRSGAGAVQYEGKWPFFAMLMFLKDTIAPGPTEGNLNLLSENEDSQTTVAGSDLEPILSPTPTTPFDSRSNSRSTEISQNFRRKRTAEQSEIDKYLEIERQKIEILRADQNKNSDSPDYHFLMSLLPYFEQFDPLEKMEIRTTIQNVIISALKKKRNNPPNIQEEVAHVPRQRHQPTGFNFGQNTIILDESGSV